MRCTVLLVRRDGVSPAQTCSNYRRLGTRAYSRNDAVLFGLGWTGAIMGEELNEASR
jgi:hypothetical protein